MNKELRQAIADHGLSAIADRLCKDHKQTIIATPSEKEATIGSSKLGGIPHLPPNLKWPVEGEEHFLFIGQINFAEVPQTIKEAPKSGWLYFFIGLDEPAYDVVHEVLYFSGDTSELAPVSPPTAQSINPDYGNTFPEVTLDFELAVTLPDYTFDESFDDYCDDLDELRQHMLESGGSRLFGHPEQWSGNPALDAHLCTNGFKSIIFDTHKTMEEAQERVKSTYASGDVDRIEYVDKWFEQLKKYIETKDLHSKEAENWQVLFQVSSVDECKMCWWDAGLLTYLIDTRNLEKTDFSRTYACIQTS